MTIGNILDYFLPSIQYIIIEDKKNDIRIKVHSDDFDDEILDLKITGFKPYKDGIWFVLSML